MNENVTVKSSSDTSLFKVTNTGDIIKFILSFSKELRQLNCWRNQYICKSTLMWKRRLSKMRSRFKIWTPQQGNGFHFVSVWNCM